MFDLVKNLRQKKNLNHSHRATYVNYDNDFVYNIYNIIPIIISDICAVIMPYLLYS